MYAFQCHKIEPQHYRQKSMYKYNKMYNIIKYKYNKNKVIQIYMWILFFFLYIYFIYIYIYIYIFFFFFFIPLKILLKQVINLNYRPNRVTCKNPHCWGLVIVTNSLHSTPVLENPQVHNERAQLSMLMCWTFCSRFTAKVTDLLTTRLLQPTSEHFFLYYLHTNLPCLAR